MSSSRRVVALPDLPDRPRWPDLPRAVDLILLPPGDTATPWPDLSPVELLVAGFGHRDRLIEVLPSMRELRAVQAMSAGVDWLRGAVPDGVTVCNARGAFDAPLAEWVVGVILAFGRGLLRARDAQGRHAWEPFGLDELAGRTVVILGLGSIGGEVGQRLRPLGVQIVGVARTARAGVAGMADLDRLLPMADVLVDLLPLTSETDGLLDARRLGLLRDGALVVNGGRGRTIRTAHLLAEVRTGRLSAALDVTDPEPLPPDHPLWALPNVLVTPHQSGDSRQASDRVWQIVESQVRRFAAGEPLDNVVPAYQLR
jgi:phosphoglycerate dehydrogenase-like enzyme